MAFLDCMGTGNFGSTRTAFCIILCQMQNRNKSLFAHQLLFERRGGGNYYANRQDQGYYMYKVYQYIQYIHVENPKGT